MKALNYIFLLCLLLSCKNNYKNSNQQSSCGNIFEIQYDKPGKYLLPTEERDKNYFIIYFEGNFNEKVKVDINQKEIFNKRVITNNTKPDDYSERILFKMDTNKKYLMNIEGEESKTCLQIPLDLNFRIIYLYYYNNKWIVRLSNNIRID